MDDYEYITSERFIHDGLIVECDQIIQLVVPLWRPSIRLDSMVLAWPSETIEDDQGRRGNGRILLPCPQEEVPLDWIKKLIVRTKAYAFFVFEDRKDGMEGLLESPHGTFNWKAPVVRHGDLPSLGRVEKAENARSYGLLWRAKQSKG